MSSKPGFWSCSMSRLRSLLQLFKKRDDSGSSHHAFPTPQRPSVAMLRYRRSNHSVYPMFRLFGCRRDMSSQRLFSRVKLNKEKDQPPDPTAAPIFFFPGWAKWIFGSLLSILIPTWKQNRDKLQTLEGEAEKVIEGAESVAEAVEKAAEFTEKVTAKIADKLPDESRLKEAAEAVEHYSKEIAHDAHLTQDFLRKVEEWKQKVDKSEAVINEQVQKKNAKRTSEGD